MNRIGCWIIKTAKKVVPIQARLLKNLILKESKVKASSRYTKNWLKTTSKYLALRRLSKGRCLLYEKLLFVATSSREVMCLELKMMQLSMRQILVEQLTPCNTKERKTTTMRKKKTHLLLHSYAVIMKESTETVNVTMKTFSTKQTFQNGWPFFSFS